MTVAPLIEARSLSLSFRSRNRIFGRSQEIQAVNNVNLTIAPGEAVGVVGESGCGKSSLGRLMLGLLAPSAGSVTFDGRDISHIHGSERRRMRRRMQMIFQDPYGSLDPRRAIGAQIADGLRTHNIVPVDMLHIEVSRLLGEVGLDPGTAERRPHQFSGGQRQRIAVARALSTRPDFIVADEPVSALDVSIQAQIVNLLADLRANLKLTMLFISHDLHVVRHLSDRLVVMYLGRVVEEGPSVDVLSRPAHPYTQALLDATPSMTNGRSVKRPLLQGELPSPANPPSGCPFRTRCAIATHVCSQTAPRLAQYTPSRRVACFKAGFLPASHVTGAG